MPIIIAKGRVRDIRKYLTERQIVQKAPEISQDQGLILEVKNNLLAPYVSLMSMLPPAVSDPIFP